jgi:hypothetical protein
MQTETNGGTVDADAITEAAEELLTEHATLYRSGIPIYTCVCDVDVVGSDEAHDHAQTCEALRQEATR